MRFFKNLLLILLFPFSTFCQKIAKCKNLENYENVIFSPFTENKAFEFDSAVPFAKLCNKKWCYEYYSNNSFFDTLRYNLKSTYRSNKTTVVKFYMMIENQSITKVYVAGHHNDFAFQKVLNEYVKAIFENEKKLLEETLSTKSKKTFDLFLTVDFTGT